VRSFVKYDYSTHPEHRPASHRAHVEWTPSRLIDWGRSIGIHTAAVIDHVIRSKLTSDYAFREIENSADSFNPYIVAFGNGEIVLRVIGEGYGTVARIEYIAPDGRTVPSAILESDWDANPRRKKRHRTTQSQDDQIRGAAERVRVRDQDILRRNYVKLVDAAARWQRVLRRYIKDA